MTEQAHHSGQRPSPEQIADRANALAHCVIEHDGEHFANTYRDALAAITREQQQHGSVDDIIGETGCHLCFIEAVIAIAAELGNLPTIHDAAQRAFEAILADTGWSTCYSPPRIHPSPTPAKRHEDVPNLSLPFATTAT